MMDGVSMMVFQLLQNMGINPDELIETANQFKQIGLQLIETQNKILENQKIIDEKLNLIISSSNLLPQQNVELLGCENADTEPK